MKWIQFVFIAVMLASPLSFADDTHPNKTLKLDWNIWLCELESATSPCKSDDPTDWTQIPVILKWDGQQYQGYFFWTMYLDQDIWVQTRVDVVEDAAGLQTYTMSIKDYSDGGTQSQFSEGSSTAWKHQALYRPFIWGDRNFDVTFRLQHQ